MGRAQAPHAVLDHGSRYSRRDLAERAAQERENDFLPAGDIAVDPPTIPVDDPRIANGIDRGEGVE